MTSINSTFVVIGRRSTACIADDGDETSGGTKKYSRVSFNIVIRKYLERKKRGKCKSGKNIVELNEYQREWVEFRMNGATNSWKRWFEKNE